MSTPASGRGDLVAIFAEPSREFSPTPIWWWSGEPVELERLLWQLNQLAEGGAFNVLNTLGPFVGAPVRART